MDEFKVKLLVHFDVKAGVLGADSQEEAESLAEDAIEDVSDQDGYPLNATSYFESEFIDLNRQELKLGKYTRGYADLTSDQLTGLLWLLGEWSCRVHSDGSLGANKNRAKVALETLQKFHREPLGREEVMALMRDAARGKE